ncbi:hypothetical protein [Streptomyces sp. NPDC020965]|uniref:hypothetical protein n=1 Tax=Streptomyces sp. NPDC020965 TaxID=3365105 RepID=UPI0037ABCFF3
MSADLPYQNQHTTAELDARIQAHGLPREEWGAATPVLLKAVHSGLVERRDQPPPVPPRLEAVPVDGCTFCRSLARHRENCRGTGDLASVLACSEEIEAHPHCASLSEMGL